VRFFEESAAEIRSLKSEEKGTQAKEAYVRKASWCNFQRNLE